MPVQAPQPSNSIPTVSPQVANRIKEFRSLLKRAILLNKSEVALMDKIPDVLLERILNKNFNNNMSLAERVLFNKYGDIDKIDRPLLDQKKNAIKNLDKATNEIKDFLSNGKKVLFLTDNDNDGSMAQAVFLEFYNALPDSLRHNVYRSYAQPIGSSRGLNKENIDLLFDYLGWHDEDVLIVTADIGINNRVEQERILKHYQNVKLVVTDHHLPVKDHVVQENDRSVIFNPQYEPTEFFKKKNISGAATLSVLLENLLKTWALQDNRFDAARLDVSVKNMQEISSWSNLLDYVEADVVDMPLRPYTIAKALDLRGLMNVSNSMGPLVTLEFTENDWAQFAQDVPELNVEVVKRAVEEVKGLNHFAQKLLAFEGQFSATSTFDDKAFFDLLAESVGDEDVLYESPNPNYIAQLRPHIFRLSAIDNKFAFLDNLKDQMVLLYDDLLKIEKELMTELRKVDMLDRVKAPNSTIVYPKSPHLTQIISRKLLNKIYNEENNGFFVVMDKVTKNEYSGSMRSLFPMNEIMSEEDQENWQNEWGVDIEVLGHSKAAGFKIKARQGVTVDQALITKINQRMSDRIEELKALEKEQTLPFLNIDFGSVGLVQKINTAVKAHLSNMNGLPCVLKLGHGKKSNVWVTDSQTTQQVNLNEVVKHKKFGYQAIQTSFDGGGFIIPIEQLRSVVDSNYNLLVKMSYMDNGVFIAHQVSDPRLMKNIVDFKGDRTDQRDLIGYYWDTYRESHFIPLDRTDFQNLPYFKYNSYGEQEFEQFEQLVIRLLDKTGQDVLAVIDTEGTGLGQAPKCFNIGGTNLRVKQGSGFEMDEEEFTAQMFRDEDGKSYLIPLSLISSLALDLENTDELPENAWRIYKGNAQGGSEHEQEYVLSYKPDQALKLSNYSKKGTQVFYNRELEGFAFSYIIKDDDFAITPEFENLTGISQDMVDKFGTSTSEVDEQLTEYYKNLKNADGRPAKIIFSAHNLPYDKGVIGSNLENFNNLMDDHVLCDTAKLARSAKLAYDDTPVANLLKVTGIPAKVYFYDSPYSGYSLSTFIDRAKRGKGGVFPDTSGRYLIRYNGEKDELSFIDKKEFNEILLDETADSLEGKKIDGLLPNNAVKFSVERMSTRAMIRNILLHDYDKPERVVLEAHEEPFQRALEAFQDQYHFDNTLEDNIRFFQISRHNKKDTLTPNILVSVGERFLAKNAKLQAKFHDGWIYEKVLSFYEPVSNEGKISQDVINQINYYTDLPRKKIEEVLQNTISFEKKFGQSHALVHEQHNNIRQRSLDGQGLSDTAYECALPNLLAMMKFYNPYNRSSEDAVNAIIDTNLRGAMQQLLVKSNHQDLAAMDSFSMRQMQAFDREMKTSLVEKAQQWFAQGGMDNGQAQMLRFKLKADTLPPGTGIYGLPKRVLTAEEIKDSADKLEYILLNEQLRTSATLSRRISSEYGERMREIAASNDHIAQEYKDILMTRFDKVEFQRKEKTIKNLSEMMQKAFQGETPNITASLVGEIRKNPDLLMTATALQVTHHEIEKRLGKPSFLSPKTAEVVSSLLEDLTKLVEKDSDTFGKKAKKKSIAFLPSFDGSPVRDQAFLPELDIRRDEPLKFILEQAGPRFLGNYIKQQTAPTVSSSSKMSI